MFQTSYIKWIEAWLIFAQLVPFTQVGISCKRTRQSIFAQFLLFTDITYLGNILHRANFAIWDICPVCSIHCLYYTDCRPTIFLQTLPDAQRTHHGGVSDILCHWHRDIATHWSDPCTHTMIHTGPMKMSKEKWFIPGDPDHCDWESKRDRQQQQQSNHSRKEKGKKMRSGGLASPWKTRQIYELCSLPHISPQVQAFAKPKKQTTINILRVATFIGRL